MKVYFMFLCLFTFQLTFASGTIISLADVSKKVQESNFAVLENAERVYQAKETINFSKRNLLPRLNFWNILKAPFDWSSSVEIVQDIAPFLVPNNWFRITQNNLFYLAQKEQYRALWANEVMTAKLLYINTLRDIDFLRLLKENDPLCKNADGYYKYFLEHEIDLMVSTISIAEYCVGGNINELPLKDIRILPFNLDHAKRTGEFAKIVFQNKDNLKLQERNIIPNDSKLFAQADIEKNIEFYLSSDTESIKIYNLLKKVSNPGFIFIDLKTPYNKQFGFLAL